jgi:hypothetical protein
MEPYVWVAEKDDPAGLFRKGDRITALPGDPDAIVRHETLPPNYGRLLDLEVRGVLRCVTPDLPRSALLAAVGDCRPPSALSRSPSSRPWAGRRGRRHLSVLP